MIYYQYEIDENGIIIAIHSSKTPFEERQITIEKIKAIKLGKTTEAELQTMD